MNIDVQTVKQHAAGRWLEILENVGGLQPDFLHFDRREGPCPKCGGDTRFRGLDESTGALFCSHCFDKKNGDGISALQWLKGWTFPETLKQLAGYLRIDGANGNGRCKGSAPVKTKMATSTPAKVRKFPSLDILDDYVCHTIGPGSKFVQVWDYGPFQVRRYNTPTPDGEKQQKQFRPVHTVQTADGRQLWALGYPDSTARPLYRPDDLQAAPPDFAAVHAGEKCVDVSWEIGIPATCNAGGENAIGKTDWSPLRRFKKVAVCIDNDKTGEKFAFVRGILKSQNPAQVVKVLCFPNVPAKGDIVDWIDGHGDAAEPETLRQEFEHLVEAAADATVEPAVDGEGEPPADYAPITCAELMAATLTIIYLIDKLLVEGQPMIVAGAKKTLKTTLLLAMALCLAAGVPFLGFSVLQAVTVLVLTGESGLATIKETIRRIAATMEIDPSGIENLLISERLPQFGNIGDLEALLELLVARGVKVLIIDPTYFCLDGEDAGNLFKQGALLRAITEVCRRAGVTLILCHHTKKNLLQPFAPPELEDIAWSGFQEYARQWILVGRRERYIPGTGSHRLWLSSGGSAGHGSLHGLNVEEGIPPERFWTAQLLPYDEVKQAGQDSRQKARDDTKSKQLDDDRLQICHALAKYPTGESKTTIRDTAGMSGTRFNRALASLLDDKTVIPTPIIKSNHKRPVEGYKLGESEA